MRYTAKIKGRGSSSNPVNRFEKIDFVPDFQEFDSVNKPKTTYFNDNTKKIITYNNSPDIIFDASINPYRGCEHGCVYCYARPTHEYLGLSAGLDFETKIFVKINAPDLLSKELGSKKWIPKPIAISGATDCYQPAERKFEITRKCLKVFSQFKNPVGIVTKNYLVTRDMDILKELSEYDCINVVISITTLDSKLSNKMEPRASHPSYRLKAIEKLSEKGIPVMVLIAPVIPGLTDHEIPKIIEESVNAGAKQAGFVILRLPHGVKDIFINWLELSYPERKNKVVHRIESIRNGKLNSSQFFDRMKGKGLFSKQIKDIFDMSCKKTGIQGNRIKLDTSHFKRVNLRQLSLFE
ncbi:MAG: PA0069 family radical SAM protein [Candidatus Dadabacteria bacterium]|nr:PA0069 family radical SAM protein [Candidatus Dadabacteria bacterium]NIQ16310.1 PA0069 family radical SAM protein [Candidatus Dadabacteria bacterium]